jgi:rare lipoprotein A (peptidoglycan hydrolase)
MHTLSSSVNSSTQLTGGAPGMASLSSTKHMLSKILSTLAGAAILSSPVLAATSAIKIQGHFFESGSPELKWSAPNFNSIQQAPIKIASQASWYGPGFHGNRTASGEIFNKHALTAAHPYLPFGTRVRVTNVRNGRSAILRVNDRGPYVGGRVIDVSYAAAKRLGMLSSGVAPVRIQVLR